MSEVNGKTLSISFRIDEGVIEHNNRIFIAKNVDGERVQDNITYCRQDIREKYDELFGQALAEYNARQKQSSRRIPDYYEHLKKSSKGKPYYEIVVQFGDMESCGQGSGKWEEAKLKLFDDVVCERVKTESDKSSLGRTPQQVINRYLVQVRKLNEV